ncbi:hypothetical protein AB0H43_32095 [Hamadaea sp. NPDC050747]|uniref:MmyB family transcriptional regulator n=1 Tax=Hamadaea sp. NPDC050747 TaxID=3155789 RepID=UPI0033CAFE67
MSQRWDTPAVAEPASEEFTALWAEHEVAVRRDSRVRVLHPAVGPIEFDYELLQTQSADQRLRLFTPPPGSRSVDTLDLLRVVGPETAHRRHR